MELLQLRYFVMTAKTENISQTAAYYIVPSSSVSHTIAKLEKELGVKLFDRTHNKIKLNAAGKRFYDGIEKALRAIDESVSTVSSALGEPYGRVNVLMGLAANLVNECAIKFQMLYPDVTFKISHFNDGVRLKDYDLFIATEPPEIENVNGIKLKESDIMVMMSRKNPLAKNESISIADLKNEKIFVADENTQMWKTVLALCRANGFEPRSLISTSYPVFGEYVRSNLGCMFVLRSHGTDRAEDNSDIAYIPIKENLGKIIIYVFWHGGKPLPKPAAMFLEYLKENFGKFDGMREDAQY